MAAVAAVAAVAAAVPAVVVARDGVMLGVDPRWALTTACVEGKLCSGAGIAGAAFAAVLAGFTSFVLGVAAEVEWGVETPAPVMA